MKRVKALLRSVLLSSLIAPHLPFRLYVRVFRPDLAQLVHRAVGHARRPFIFIQVGSNDGRTGDPLFEAIANTDVRGILVEPIPQLFERLRQTYAGKAGLVLVNAAIADEGDVRELYWVPPKEGDPIWAEQLGSFSREIVLSHEYGIPDIAERIATLSVACRSIASLVDEHGLTRVDLVHIDAEGADFAILKSLEFRSRWSPRYVLYEQKHLDDDRSRALRLMWENGYRTVVLGADVFAYRGAVYQLLVRLQARFRSLAQGDTN